MSQIDIEGLRRGDVGAAKARVLRSDLQVSEQTSGAKTFVVVKLPDGRFFRFSKAGFQLLRDGNCPDEKAAAFFARAARLGLFVDVAAEKPAYRPRDPLYYEVPILNPSRFLVYPRRWMSPLFSARGVLAFGVLGVLACGFIGIDWTRFVATFGAIASVRDGLVAYGLFLASSLLHEVGHAVACIKCGGQVRRMGIIINMFQPGFFTDVSDAWLFPDKRARLSVSLAGLYVQGYLMFGAAFVWRFASATSGVSHVAFILVVVLGLSTLVNLIPFFRLDGYFILSDALGIPNLRSRSVAFCLSLLPWVGARLAPAQPVRGAERAIFLAYGGGTGVFFFFAIRWLLRGTHALLVRITHSEAIAWWIAGAVMAFTLSLTAYSHLRRSTQDGAGSPLSIR